MKSSSQGCYWGMAGAALVWALGGPEVAAATRLVDAGSSWRYWHRPQPAPAGWNQPGFPAQLEWLVASAKFGFGDDAEVTVLADDGTLTSYFRQEFFLETTGPWTNGLGRIVADDGAVVFLNGVEVARLNIYPGPVGYDTLAANDLGRPAETNWANFVLAGGLLRPGPNVVAVEVHQASPFSRDLGFDFELWANVENLQPILTIAEPAAGETLLAGSNVRVRARVQDVGNQVSNLVFSVDGLERFTAGSAIPEFVWADVPPGPHVVSVGTVLRSGEVIRASDVVVSVVAPEGYATLVPNGAVWRYWDRGTDPGSGWAQPGYFDGEWPAGPAELGYGDGGVERRPERTLISGGPSSANRIITTYFRHAFLVDDPAAVGPMVVRLLRDDGARVYLNGVEVVRNNLPPGPLDAGTLAETAADDGTVFFESPVPAGRLVAGWNVLAVEVHQSSPESSDLSFDLMLLAREELPRLVVQPMSVVSPYCVDVTLHGEASGPAQYQWFRNGLPLSGAVTPFLTLTQVERAAAGVYWVAAANPAGTTLSEPAEVQVCLTKRGALLPGVMATTNLGALFALETSTGGGSGGGGGGFPSPQVHLGHGVPLYFSSDNGASNALVPSICGVPAARTKWVGHYSLGAQRLRVSTEGSDFDTVVGIYTNSGGLNPRLIEVACDRGTAAVPQGVVEFEAGRRFYYIAVDGENGATGTVRLKIGLGSVQAASVGESAGTFYFEVAVRSNVTSVVRSTNGWAGASANFDAWPIYGRFQTNRDWVFPQVISNLSAVPSRYFGGLDP